MPPNHPPDKVQALPHDSSRGLIDAASILISKHRNHLDWVLMLPTWETLVDQALRKLNVETTRQGISRKRTLLSLPLELKYETIKKALGHANNHLPIRFAIKMAGLWGIYINNRGQLESRLNSTQWDELKRSISLRMSVEHKKYKTAQNLLFQEYHALAQSISLQVCLDPSKREDCIQEARYALLKAIDSVQPNRNLKAYASQWIERGVRNFLIRNKLPISAPLNLISKALRARNSNSEIPKGLATIFHALENPQVSLDEIIEDHDERTQRNRPDIVANQSDLNSLVREALENLTPKQQEVIRLKFGPHTGQDKSANQEIGSALGITGQQVGRRQKRALASLANILGPIANELA